MNREFLFSVIAAVALSTPVRATSMEMLDNFDRLWINRGGDTVKVGEFSIPLPRMRALAGINPLNYGYTSMPRPLGGTKYSELSYEFIIDSSFYYDTLSDKDEDHVILDRNIMSADDFLLVPPLPASYSCLGILTQISYTDQLKTPGSYSITSSGITQTYSALNNTAPAYIFTPAMSPQFTAKIQSDGTVLNSTETTRFRMITQLANPITIDAPGYIIRSAHIVHTDYATPIFNFIQLSYSLLGYIDFDALSDFITVNHAILGL